MTKKEELDLRKKLDKEIPEGFYSIEGGEATIITILLEWMDHKEYEKVFKY